MSPATPQDRLEGYTWALSQDGLADEALYTRATFMALLARETWMIREKLDAAVGLAIAEKEGRAAMPLRVAGSVGAALTLLKRDSSSLARLFEAVKDPRRVFETGEPLEAHRINPAQFDLLRPQNLRLPVAFTTLHMRERLLRNGQDLEGPVMEQFLEIEGAVDEKMPLRQGQRQLPDAQRRLLFLMALLGERGHVPNSGSGARMLSQAAAEALKNNFDAVKDRFGRLIRLPQKDGPPRYRVSPRLTDKLGGQKAVNAFMNEVVGFDQALWQEAVSIHFKTKEELEALGREVEKGWPTRVPTHSAGSANGGIELDSRKRYRLKPKDGRNYLPDFRRAVFKWFPTNDRRVSEYGFDPATHALFKTTLEGREHMVPLKLEDLEAVA